MTFFYSRMEDEEIPTQISVLSIIKKCKKIVSFFHSKAITNFETKLKKKD